MIGKGVDVHKTAATIQRCCALTTDTRAVDPTLTLPVKVVTPRSNQENPRIPNGGEELYGHGRVTIGVVGMWSNPSTCAN
jgi:hypothetical protein